MVVRSIKTDQGLNSKVKGLWITSTNSGALGSEMRTGRMGAVSCVNANNQPLLVVDDLPVLLSHLSSVKPNEVANVEILKGSVAFALYGLDGRDGVIIVTTKKKAREKMQMAKDSIAKKIISKVSDTISLALNTNSLKIYPNPVPRGNAFLISFKQQRVNDFNIRITDVQGRVMIQKQAKAFTREHFEKILTDGSWSSGIYYMTMLDKNNKLISKKSFVVQ